MGNLLYVQYGCGLSAPKGWLNYDASPSLLISKTPILNLLFKKFIPPFPLNVKYGNIIKGLPIKENSARGVYASHVLEHLSLYDFRISITNTYKMLEFGGIFRLVVPDLEWIVKTYLQEPAAIRSYNFMRNASIGIEKKERGIVAYFRGIAGRSSHLWLWDYASLEKELELVGFKDIRRATFNDSIDVKFSEVEDKGRFENALAIEAKK